MREFPSQATQLCVLLEGPANSWCRGCEPLTGEDIAEAIVFAAGRRENVVIADTLIFPNHQAAATVMHKKST